LSSDIAPGVKRKMNRAASAADAAILSTAKGSGILAAGKIVETGGRFVVAVLLARILGADQFGQYTLALATTALVASIGKVGMDSAVVRFVAVFSGNKDEAGIWGVLQIALALALCASILLGLGLYFLAETIALRIYHEPQLASLLRLGVVMVPIAVLNDILIGASRGFKRMHFPVLAQDIVHLLVRLALIGALAFTGLNAYLAILTYGIADLVSVVILFYLLNGVFPWKRPLQTARRELRNILSFSVPLFLSEMLKTFRSDIQTILLGATYAVASVGVFTVASKINMISRISSFSLMASAEPAFAELHAKEDRGQMLHLYRATSRWMFALNFPVVLITILFAEPLLAIFGESFVSGSFALILLSLSTLVTVSTGLAGTVIEMAGYTRLKLINSVTQLALFVITSALFIPRWGVIGAATAALLSSGIIQVARLVQIAILLRMQPYDIWFARAAASAAVTSALAFYTRWQFHTDANLIFVAFHTAAILLVYAGTMLLFGLAPQDKLIVVQMLERVRTLFLDRGGRARRFLAGAGD